MAKRKKRLCVNCEKRPALHWQVKGPKKMRWNKDHGLCQRCYQSIVDREMFMSKWRSSKRAGKLRMAYNSTRGNGV